MTKNVAILLSLVLSPWLSRFPNIRRKGKKVACTVSKREHVKATVTPTLVTTWTSNLLERFAGVASPTWKGSEHQKSEKAQPQTQIFPIGLLQQQSGVCNPPQSTIIL